MMSRSLNHLHELNINSAATVACYFSKPFAKNHFDQIMASINSKYCKRWLWFLLSAILLLFSWPYFQYMNSISGTSINITNIFLPTNDNNSKDNQRDHPTIYSNISSNFTPLIREKEDPCAGKYIYVHQLPRRFNDDLLRNCHDLGQWTDFCQNVVNNGFGPRIQDPEDVVLNTSWYRTDQFMLSVMFHYRLKIYDCLTQNSSLASAIHVPFYAGLEVGSHLYGSNTSVRDAAALDLNRWLMEQEEWRAMNGRDHFLVSGRITWDLRRDVETTGIDWGSNFLTLSAARNMTVLIIESSPWARNDFAVPYPTSFHPREDDEVHQWQEVVRRQERRYLFTFQGSPRPNASRTMRSELIKQCLASEGQCKFVDCSQATTCNDPVHVMRNFKNSVFCLQPTGDSFTRRSTFDSVLAGCIPVFFHPGSAYTQYLWHLPKNFTKYSVFISVDDVKKSNATVEQVLARIPKNRILAMREEVIRLIPRIIYSWSKLKGTEDAFDEAIKRTFERINGIREKMKEGKQLGDDFPELASWKYYLSGTVEEHEWDSYFCFITPHCI